MSTKYIHYGNTKYDDSLFKPIKNIYWLKPAGGLWASRVDAKFGWKDWAERNNFRKHTLDSNNCFYFELSSNARILRINSIHDLEGLPRLKFGSAGLVMKLVKPTQVFLEFEELAKHCDAIEFNISSDPRLYWYLYGWDCDCTLIMNKEIIII